MNMNSPRNLLNLVPKHVVILYLCFVPFFRLGWFRSLTFVEYSSTKTHYRISLLYSSIINMIVELRDWRICGSDNNRRIKRRPWKCVHQTAIFLGGMSSSHKIGFRVIDVWKQNDQNLWNVLLTADIKKKKYCWRYACVCVIYKH